MDFEVASEWERMDWLAHLGANGDLITYTDPKRPLCRRDVVNNADILGPLVAQLGALLSIPLVVCLLASKA